MSTHYRLSATRNNPIDWWGWWEIIKENNPDSYDHYLELTKNNPPGIMPCLNNEVPF